MNVFYCIENDEYITDKKLYTDYYIPFATEEEKENGFNAYLNNCNVCSNGSLMTMLQRLKALESKRKFSLPEDYDEIAENEREIRKVKAFIALCENINALQENINDLIND